HHPPWPPFPPASTSSSPLSSSRQPSPPPSPAGWWRRRRRTRGTWWTRRRRRRRRRTTTSWSGEARRGARSPRRWPGRGAGACWCWSGAARPRSSRRSPPRAGSSGRSPWRTRRPSRTRPRRPSPPRTACPTSAPASSAAPPPSTPASTRAPTLTGSAATARSGGEAMNWDMKLVNSSYEWVERELAFQPVVRGWQAAVRAGLLEANVTPWNGFTMDHVSGTKVGATTFDSSGRRRSAADLLAFARPGRLRVAIRATVTRIIMSPIEPVARRGRSPQPAVAASGVVYQDRLLQQHHALLRPGGEVILSAGSLGSPQLLLLSGIGPANDLTSLGIPVFADVPDVGKHMFDNPRNGISIIPSIPIDHSLIQVVGIPSANGNESYLEAASYIVPLAPILRRGGPFSPSSPLYVTVVTIMEKVPGPLSEGSLWLTSSNPLESPSVRFNYLSRREDLARCVTGMRRVAKVLESTTMDVFRSAMGSLSQDSRRREFRIVGAALPVDWRTNDTALGDFCQQTVATLWHYHGGCVAGSVVDRDFRVFRVRALRVVDGSTFRETPGTNPQATIMMMGRYIGQKMIDERHSRRQVRTSTDSSSNA
ncbi:Os06g0656000, partial [Oryza sativa Japonica Group]